MYRQTLIPTEKDHTIDLPEDLYGKKVEVIVNKLEEKTSERRQSKKDLPSGLKDKKFWENIEYNIDFPSIDEIREIAWPKRKS